MMMMRTPQVDIPDEWRPSFFISIPVSSSLEPYCRGQDRSVAVEGEAIASEALVSFSFAMASGQGWQFAIPSCCRPAEWSSRRVVRET